MDDGSDDILGPLENRFLAGARGQHGKGKIIRRGSVAAESFDPEKEDDDDADDTVIHAKTDDQRSRLVEAIKPILIFRSLDEAQREVVLNNFQEKQVVPDEKVITQGEDGDNFYVIESGKYNVFVNGEKFTEYEGSGFFGELALMYNCPRAATIVATTPGVVWAMDRNTFRRIVLKSAFKKRQMYEKLLSTVNILNELSAYERSNVADALVSRVFYDGEEIIKEGEIGDKMFFVEKGNVRVTKASDAGKPTEEVTKLAEGDYFGEISLLTDKPRLASAHAVGKVKVAELEKASFERLMGPCISLMQRNLPKYRDRLQSIFGDDASAIIPELSESAMAAARKSRGSVDKSSSE